MILRLNTSYPLLWRSTGSLQLGVDDPPVILPTVTIAEERMLAALTVGITRSGLSLIGTQSGLTESEVEVFYEQLRPALESPRPTDRPTIVVAGVGPTVDRLGYRLTEAGLRPELVGQHPDDAIGTPALHRAPFAIVVAHYVLDPEFYGLWLRRDIPHLPVVFGDTGVRIGPIIEPGRGPCLYCLDRQRTDADPAWPTLAAQLWGTVSTTESPLLASEAATVAARLALNHVRGVVREVVREAVPGAQQEAATSFTIDATSGEITSRRWLPHPECACSGFTASASASAPADLVAASLDKTGLAETDSAIGVGAASGASAAPGPPVQPGTGTVHSPPSVARSTATRRDAAADVPA